MTFYPRATTKNAVCVFLKNAKLKYDRRHEKSATNSKEKYSAAYAEDAAKKGNVKKEDSKRYAAH
jgi:hypothetical protein